MKELLERYKKYLPYVIVAVCAVWVFCIAFAVTYAVTSKNVEESTTFSEITRQTMPAASSTEAITEESKVQIDNNAVLQPATTPQTDAKKNVSTTEAKIDPTKIPKTKTEIVNTYVAAINGLKQKTDFSMTKDSQLTLTLDSVSDAGQITKNLATKLLKQAQEPKSESYTFVGGIDAKSGYSPKNVIPPKDKTAALIPGNVVYAESAATKSGGYKLKINLGKDTQTLERDPAIYSTIVAFVDPTDIASYSSLKISKLAINYSQSIIEATFDKNGRLTTLRQSTTASNGQSDITYLNKDYTLVMHGEQVANYTFKY